MKKLLGVLAFLVFATAAYAQPGRPPLNIRESDGSPSTYPYQLKVSNDSLTDNGDGTATFDPSVSATTYGTLALSDGTNTGVLNIYHSLQGPVNLTSAYDVDTDLPLMYLDSTVFPNGIVITGWSISSTVADPTTELDANLMYCDDPTTGAFPGASATLIDVLDTTTGNASETDMSNSDLGSGTIAVSKWIYIDMDADPTDTLVYWLINLEYYVAEP